MSAFQLRFSILMDEEKSADLPPRSPRGSFSIPSSPRIPSRPSSPHLSPRIPSRPLSPLLSPRSLSPGPSSPRALSQSLLPSMVRRQSRSQSPLRKIPSITRQTALLSLLLITLVLAYFAPKRLSTSLSAPSASPRVEWIDSGDSLNARRWRSNSQAVYLPEPAVDVTSQEWKCRDWDPTQPEELDPQGCLRARQYRQVMRVIEREERGEHAHFDFTTEHNLDVFHNISRCFLPTAHANHTECPEKPLVVTGWWYSAEAVYGATSGEIIWQASLFKQLQSIGMSVACMGPYENWVEAAEMMPDVYRFLWNGDVDITTCITDPRCVAKEHYVPPEDAEDLSIGVPDEERGVIPIWQLQVVDYWGARPREISGNGYWWNLQTDGDWSYHPLGHEWINTPWPLPSGHVHLPYSIEEYCMSVPFTPHEEREDAGLIFTKRSEHFHYGHVSPIEFWSQLNNDTTMELVLTADVDEKFPLPEGLESRGRQTREGFEELLGNVKVMIGMGAPTFSPSVYSALCQGTPVIIPILIDDDNYRTDDWNLYGSWSQHGPATQLGAPYVYTYHKNNYTELLEVVEKARATPIERYIPEDMRLVNALPKLQAYVDRDLEAMFNDVVAANGGTVPRMGKGLRERCYELGSCMAERPVGNIPKTPKNAARLRQAMAAATVEASGVN